ncbi:metalloregulator ArsR/SmtB family transcription factor [Marivirga tractuosa]|uniref:ArsR/SmtB family transcription factor n=1 Tax=Marivirga tractuosa TaxID=1006 RepID=UPI0035D117FE
MSKSCIRVFADVEQIQQCKEEINKVAPSIATIAMALSLSGNEARLKMLYLLSKETKLCPCDLSDILEMTVPAISQHLKKLREGGLVTSEKVGQTVFYSLVEDNIQVIRPVLESLFNDSKKEPVS